MRLALLALCGCNQVFGVGGEVIRSDARQFDAPPDAQPYCPPFGTVPTFSQIAHEILDQDCEDYTISASANIALARCEISSNVFAFVQGPIDSRLDQVALGIDEGDSDHTVSAVRISPDGDTATIASFDIANTMTTIESFTRNGTTWTRGPNIATSVLAGVSTPTHGPVHHMLSFDATSAGVTEIVDTNNTWTIARTLPIGSATRDAWLSPDGLRALVLSNDMAPAWTYLDRPDIDSDFVAHAFTTLPPVVGLFVTEDCTRAYMSSVQAVFYAPQI